jgi:hypothetical protein
MKWSSQSEIPVRTAVHQNTRHFGRRYPASKLLFPLGKPE